MKHLLTIMLILISTLSFGSEVLFHVRGNPQEYGYGLPDYGDYHYPSGTVLTNRMMSNYIDTNDVSCPCYLLGGWTLISGGDSTNNGTNFPAICILTLTNETYVFWEWEKGYLLHFNINSNGTWYSSTNWPSDFFINNIGGVRSGWKPDGSNITITAPSYINFSFDGWTGDIVSTDSTINVTMNGNKTITANFRPSDFRIINCYPNNSGGSYAPISLNIHILANVGYYYDKAYYIEVANDLTNNWYIDYGIGYCCFYGTESNITVHPTTSIAMIDYNKPCFYRILVTNNPIFYP